MSKTPEFLSQRCQAIHAGAGDAITWVNQTRGGAQRLDRDGDGLIERLRRQRNLAHRLSQAALRPMSVGFFGLSQAGKSYLISSLARGSNGQLETVLDGERLDFIDHINPPGGGKEATGLVTRFTRQPVRTTAGYPVLLSLLNEADIIKILGNSFYLDFNWEQINLELPLEQITSRLRELEKRRQPTATGGMSEDDVVDLADYFERRFRKSNALLAGVFWPTATTLAPYLLPQDRASLFALVWGDLKEFTACYATLQSTLASLGFAPTVHAPTAALVEKDGGVYTQANSIMNVDAVRARFGCDSGALLGVLPVQDGSALSEVRVQRSFLAALTKEMVFSLAETPRVSLLEKVDLLDFPGYRGRMGLSSLAAVSAPSSDSNLIGSLLLRGKVAYLFERYTDDQEMNTLVVCNPSDKQIEVNALAPVLQSWIDATQGASPAERAQRTPGLLWALTMFDKRMQDNMGQSDSNLDIQWKGMMELALTERFKDSKNKDGWVEEWSPGRPFNNVFLVRKPGMSKGIFEMTAGSEGAVYPEAQNDITRMRTSFAANELVQKHVHDPLAAWDAMMQQDDGGMNRMVVHLQGLANIETKLTRIAEQIAHIQREIAEVQLGSYYRADGADEVARKDQIADLVLSTLRTRSSLFGETLRLLQPSTEHLRALYLNAESTTPDTVEAPTKAAPTVSAAPAEGGLFSLDIFAPAAPSPQAAAPAPTAAPAVNRRAAAFAKAAISDWLRQLRQLPESPDAQRFLSLGSDVLQGLVDELITGAMRFRLEEKVAEALHHSSNRAGATRNKLVDQQVLVASTIINDYVDYLGYSEQDPAQRPASVMPGACIFAPPPPIAPDTLPELQPSALQYSALYVLDWFEAFRATARGNAGHAAGSEITPEQNHRLGQILAVITNSVPPLGLAGA